LAPKSGYRRGYAVAVIIGFAECSAGLWHVYSKVVKPVATVRLESDRKNVKAVYNFHEAIIDALRPTLKESVRSIIIVSPPRTTYTREFTEHMRIHHAWLSKGANRVSVAEMMGSAATRSDVAALARNPVFRRLIQDATAQETENLVDLLESRLGDSSGEYTVLFSLDDVEDLIVNRQNDGLVPEFLILTNDYLSRTRQKGRLNRLMQVASNRKVRTRVVDAETPAGKRLTQLGGIVCIAKTAQRC
jgi:stalled ribosome rescue protein Dom34